MKIGERTHVHDRSFFSEALGEDRRYRIFIPPAAAANKPRGVVYLLHGLFGSADNWTDNCAIFDDESSIDHFVVMPDSGDNWYTDSAKGKFETAIAIDLVDAVEREFNLEGQRRERVIAGISMGGYGAFKIALLYPDRFRSAVSFSGAFHATRLERYESDHSEIAPSIKEVFAAFEPDALRREDLFDTIGRVTRAEAAWLPDLIFDCGVDDPFIEVNRDLDALMTEKGVAHAFASKPGGHTWDYWCREVGSFLR